MADEVRTRRLPWLGIACAVALFGVSIGVVVQVTRPEPVPHFCGGVGLVAERSAPTPEQALADWLAAAPDEPPFEDWKRKDSSDGWVSFEPRKGAGSGRYESVSVAKGALSANGQRFPADEWSLDGACVGGPG